MKKNRILGLVLTSVLAVSVFCGCGTGTAFESDQKGKCAAKCGECFKIQHCMHDFSTV